jgi:protein TonB
MIPQSQARKPKNSSKVNLFISFAFHALLVVVLFYFAAREGLLGKKLEKISVQLIREKPPAKPKPPEPKVEPPKVEPPKVEPPKLAETPRAAAPPAVAPPVVAPATAELPSFEFGGGKTVETSSDPVQLYKGFMEYSLRAQWNRPENLADDAFVAEVDLAVARDGTLGDPRWQHGSGNAQWDQSVRAALAAVPRIDRAPPTNFPPRVVIRFDVQEATEPVAP